MRLWPHAFQTTTPLVTQVVDGLLSFIAANPAKSADWKAQADSQLASNDQQGA